MEPDDFRIALGGLAPEELAAEFERWFAVTDAKLLDYFVSERLTQEWLDEEGGYQNSIEAFLRYMTGSDPEVLVDWEIGGSGPMVWGTQIGSYRLGESGYLYLWTEPDVESGYPILASWAPYDDDEAFAAAFIMAHRDEWALHSFHGSPTLGSRVSSELLERALKESGWY
jgi:hypothetical protein